MNNQIIHEIWDILACPFCNNSLVEIKNGARCMGCNEEYYYNDNNQLDLRLKKNKICSSQFMLGTDLLEGNKIEFEVLKKNTSSQVDYKNFKAPRQFTKELMSYFPMAKNSGIMLDLGCGNTVHREVCEHAGFKYIGLDYGSPEALILGDAHALPFKDNSFDFLLSISMLQYLRFPFVAIKEIYRIIKLGCTFIGSVSFLEPFHGTCYHYTHWGIFNLLQFAGFDIKYIAPSKKWSVLKAQSCMMLFPRLPRWIAKTLVMPLYIIHRLWWKLGCLIARRDRASEKNRILFSTGSFCFVSSKPK